MHRIGAADLGDGVVDVLAAEQLLLQLTEEGGTDPGVRAHVGQRFVEALGDDRETARGVEDVAGPFLNEEEVVGLASEDVRWSRDGQQRERASRAQPVADGEDSGGIGEVVLAQGKRTGLDRGACGESVGQLALQQVHRERVLDEVRDSHVAADPAGFHVDAEQAVQRVVGEAGVHGDDLGEPAHGGVDGLFGEDGGGVGSAPGGAELVTSGGEGAGEVEPVGAGEHARVSGGRPHPRGVAAVAGSRVVVAGERVGHVRLGDPAAPAPAIPQLLRVQVREGSGDGVAGGAGGPGRVVVDPLQGRRDVRVIAESPFGPRADRPRGRGSGLGRGKGSETFALGWRRLLQCGVQQLLHFRFRPQVRFLVPSGDGAGCDSQPCGEGFLTQAQG